MIEDHAAFRHLTRIDARLSYLSSTVAARLVEVLPSAIIEGQRDPGDARYCQIGE